jgi:hypothetical protein
MEQEEFIALDKNVGILITDKERRTISDLMEEKYAWETVGIPGAVVLNKP